ncbi:hypothetical protein [Flammeovirga agarivorans]|uniref:Uncharacterized protein n=1 Tax=Flammeovirga agarivorans TaxID=2726742 RepID=A0A7X8XZG4_9BACT|nr:hypothetical protein [Flammeovirga agarivorans]NLR95028.1 hypothetical protein [Flammeovirga agarivorans]
MNNKITIKQALQKGRNQILFPSLLIGFGGMPILFYALRPINSPFTPLLSIFLPLLLALFYTSIIIPIWKIWAYSRVDNAHLLYRKAVEQSIISNDNTFASKLVIMTKSQKEKLKLLQEKISENYHFVNTDFIDNKSIPEETIIYYDKVWNTIQSIFGLIGIVVGIYLLYEKEINIILSIVIIGYSLYSSQKNYKESRNKDPQITLNKDGVKIKDDAIINWRYIKKAEAYVKGYGNNSKECLKINSNKGVYDIELEDYDTSISELNDLIYIYKGRSKRLKKA